MTEEGIADPIIEEETTTKVSRPKRYHAILLNDDYTPMDFVVAILQEIFDKTGEDAIHIMLEVHKKGRGVAGTYSHEIAHQKATEAVDAATAHGYPLMCIVEAAPSDDDESE